MATVGTKKRLSNGVKTLLIENDAVVGLDGTTQKILLDGSDIEPYERATIQIRNNGHGDMIVKAWGSLFEAPGTTPATNSKWVQIGDNISVTNNTGAIKSISTRGLKALCVTGEKTGAGTPNFTAGDCLVFLQGTI